MFGEENLLGNGATSFFTALLQIKADNPLRSPAVTDSNTSEPLVWPFELCLI